MQNNVEVKHSDYFSAVIASSESIIFVTIICSVNIYAIYWLAAFFFQQRIMTQGTISSETVQLTPIFCCCYIQPRVLQALRPGGLHLPHERAQSHRLGLQEDGSPAQPLHLRQAVGHEQAPPREDVLWLALPRRSWEGKTKLLIIDHFYVVEVIL